jgi:hypothetical protein
VATTAIRAAAGAGVVVTARVRADGADAAFARRLCGDACSTCPGDAAGGDAGAGAVAGATDCEAASPGGVPTGGPLAVAGVVSPAKTAAEAATKAIRRNRGTWGDVRVLTSPDPCSPKRVDASASSAKSGRFAGIRNASAGEWS